MTMSEVLPAINFLRELLKTKQFLYSNKTNEHKSISNQRPVFVRIHHLNVYFATYFCEKQSKITRIPITIRRLSNRNAEKECMQP